MKLTMLGTGSAMATACYNTCFALEADGSVFLVDGGGGNGIFEQLNSAHIDWRNIRDVFVTHKHMDHILGALWVIRLFTQSMADGRFDQEIRVYGHREVIEILDWLTKTMLVPEQIIFIGSLVRLITVTDGQQQEILGRTVTFFDIRSEKALQFGFTMELKGGKLACCGDEPVSNGCIPYIGGSKWLMLEAFCLYAQREHFKPYEKHHSTVKDACQLAQRMQAENLILYHTEDKNLRERKDLYTQEGSAFFTGHIHVPADLEAIELD